LREYVTVAQEAAHVVVYPRFPDEWHFKEFSDLNQTIQLASIDCALALSRVYRKIIFTPGS